MLNRARNQSSFLQGWGNIISLSGGIHHPPPVVSSRIPAQRAPWWDGLWRLLSPTWLSFVGSVQAVLSSHCSGRCWREPLAEPGAAWAVGSVVPSACKTNFFPKQEKILHLHTGRRPEQQLCWETPCSSEMRNQMGFPSFPKGHECR